MSVHTCQGVWRFTYTNDGMVHCKGVEPFSAVNVKSARWILKEVAQCLGAVATKA